MASDPSYTYGGTNERVSDQADSWAAVVPNDATVLIPIPKALYVGVGGNIALRGRDDVVEAFAVSAGQILPLRPKGVMATGTTASGIKALY